VPGGMGESRRNGGKSARGGIGKFAKLTFS